MIIWIYVASIAVGGSVIDGVAEGQLKYAFVDKSTCEKMIRDLSKMKCIPLKLVENE